MSNSILPFATLPSQSPNPPHPKNLACHNLLTAQTAIINSVLKDHMPHSSETKQIMWYSALETCQGFTLRLFDRCVR